MLIFWRMLNTGTYGKHISIVNRSCVPKPVIRILCASLAYKEWVIWIHSIFGISVLLSTAQSMAITCTICSLHIYWFGHRITTFIMHCINRVVTKELNCFSSLNTMNSLCRTKSYQAWQESQTELSSVCRDLNCWQALHGIEHWALHS